MREAGCSPAQSDTWCSSPSWLEMDPVGTWMQVCACHINPLRPGSSARHPKSARPTSLKKATGCIPTGARAKLDCSGPGVGEFGSGAGGSPFQEGCRELVVSLWRAGGVSWGQPTGVRPVHPCPCVSADVHSRYAAKPPHPAVPHPAGSARAVPFGAEGPVEGERFAGCWGEAIPRCILAAEAKE